MTSFIPPVSKLSENVIRILGCNPGPMTLQGTNTYLIGKGKRKILVDTGDGEKPEYVSLLKRTLEENNIGLQQILITHWHHDHIGGVTGLLKELDLKCPVSKLCLKDANIDQEPKLLAGYTYLKDGEQLKTEGATLRVVHTPGHTQDHMVLYLEEDESLFSGDCILGEGTAVFEDLHSYMNSLIKILELKPKRIYPGHGPEVGEPVVKIQQYIQHRQQREAQILQALEAARPNAMTAIEVVNTVYEGLQDNLKYAAAYNVTHHLHKLQKDNKIELSSNDGEESFRVK